MNSDMRDWSSLPEELVECVADKLEHSDYWRFRAVCKSWSSFPPYTGSFLYSNLPYQVPTVEPLFAQTGKPVFLVANNVCLLQLIDEPDKSWIVSVDEFKPGKLRCFHPLNCTLFWGIPNSLNLSNIRVSTLSEELKFCYADGSTNVFNSTWKIGQWFLPKILIVPGDDDNDNDVRLEGCVAIVLIVNKEGDNLFSLHLGTGECKPITHEKCSEFDDIVRYGVTDVLAIDRKKTAYVIDHRTWKVSEHLTLPIRGVSEGSISRNFLVNSDEGLYLIRIQDDSRPCVYPREILVCKLNKMQQEWHRVHSFDNRKLLVSFGGCFFVDAGNVAGFRGNCIVFPSICWFSRKLFVFFLGDEHVGYVSDFPFIQLPFWPFPSWIEQYSSYN